LAAALLLPPPPAQAATVVAADGVLCDLTRTLADGLITVVCLLPASQDPHQAALRPSDRQVLAQSDLVLVNGFGLTPALSKVQGRRPQVAVAELAVPNSPSFEGAGGVRDPHVWHDPRQAAAMVRLIAERLAPFTDQDSRLRSRSQQAALVLTDLDAWTARQIATLPPSARVLASGHRAFRSFARRYGIRELAVIESFSTAGLLRPQGLNQVSDALQRSGARVIFPDRLPPSKTLRASPSAVEFRSVPWPSWPMAWQPRPVTWIPLPPMSAPSWWVRAAAATGPVASNWRAAGRRFAECWGAPRLGSALRLDLPAFSESLLPVVPSSAIASWLFRSPVASAGRSAQAWQGFCCSPAHLR
jgi:zinc/manganese transport system substrate-binding protein